MPHIVVKGSSDGMQSIVFGLNQNESVVARGKLAVWGNRVGQDGQPFNNPPFEVLSVLEQVFGYRVISSTSGPHSIALDGEEMRVKSLLDKGVDPNLEDKSGYTALHYAARAGHIGVCKILLNAGASVNAVTRAGKATPLHRAALAGKEQVVDLLLKSNANPKQQDSDGRTALHRAREGSHRNIESQLLSACPDLIDMP